MSCVINGIIVDNDITKNAKGGTELMRDRLLSTVDKNLLRDVAIHFSRVTKIYRDKKNILYAHDLPEDSMYSLIMSPEYINYIDLFVFVSYHQRDLFLSKFKIPLSKVVVIHNAIGDYFHFKEYTPVDTYNFIYHTTPHRGLELVYPVIDKLSKDYSIHLNVYSSFNVYGWPERDEPYKKLFENISSHKNMTYYGSVSNSEIIDNLKKNHVFLYPCIWHETSCLALMEAIQNGCICLHSDLGALPETARGMTYMFSATEDYNELVSRAYDLSKYILDNYKDARQDINNKTKYYYPYSLVDYSVKWNQTLKELHYGKSNTISKANDEQSF